MSTSTDYRTGQRRFADWLRGHGIRLARIVDNGLQRDDAGWCHFAWTLVVQGTGTEAYEFPYRMGVANRERPTLVDIMSALFSEARCALGDFDEFCGDLGYDTDSMKARATYDEIRVNNGRLLRLFRLTDLDALLDTVAPMLEAAGL